MHPLKWCASSLPSLEPERRSQWREASDLFGPGTPTFYTDGGGHMMMSIQAWAHTGGTSNPQNHGQIMRTYEITVDDSYMPTATLVRTDR